MKVAAYQAPLLPGGSMAALQLIRDRVKWCETEDVDILCCPEAVLGGLADDVERPADIAIDVKSGQLAALLAPLGSRSVTAIVGFTETAGAGKLYNSAAVFRDGRVVGIYRKRHPAIRRSVYSAGDESPIFTVGSLSFGIMICNDSNSPSSLSTWLHAVPRPSSCQPTTACPRNAPMWWRGAGPSISRGPGTTE
jgi:predicted amidohydrolase